MNNTDDNPILQTGDVPTSVSTDTFLEETLQKIEPITYKQDTYTPPASPTPPETLPVSEQVSTVQPVPKTPEGVHAEPQTNTPPEPEDYEKVVLTRAYENDLSQAMSVTEAKVVQTLLREAREREEDVVIKKKERKARKWYLIASIMLLICTLGAIGYAVYTYTKLTVPAVQHVSVGIFSTTDQIVARDTSIETVLQNLQTAPLTEGRPYIVELIESKENPIPLSSAQLFSFLETTANEPFSAAFTTARLGVIKIDDVVTPFIIGATADGQHTLKELLIAEPSLVASFQKSLPVQPELIAGDSLTTFVSEYRFNIALRTLYTTTLEGLRRITLLYGLLNENTVVLTTNPEIVRIVYETLIKQ